MSINGEQSTAPPLAVRRTRWLRLSLRLRLTLLTVLVFMLIQSAISAGRYLYVERELDGSLRGKLEEQTRSLATTLGSTASLPSNEGFASLIETEPRSILVEELLVSLFTEDGRLVATNSKPEVSFDLAGGRDATKVGEFVHRRFDIPALQTPEGGRRPGRTAATRFTDSSGRKLVLVVATSDVFVTQLTRELRNNILIAIPIGLVAALVSGWLIAGIAVRPLLRLQQIAQMLRPDSLGDRIDIGSTATEVARLQERLNEARDRLEAGYKAQEQFAGNVAHELKTPLAIIVAQAELLRMDPALPQHVRQFVDGSRDEALRLARMCDSFLLLARVRHGKPIADRARPFLVNVWIMESVQDCTAFARRFKADLAPTLLDDDDIDVEVMGDHDMLTNMLDNLIRNACRFSPAGKPVEVRASLVEGDQVEVAVRDYGPGMPPQLLERVFDRFVQADDGAAGRRGGGGIGLQIAHGIAELHGGKTYARNAPDGAGCIFTVRLPRSRTTPVAAPDALSPGESRLAG